MQKVIIKEYNDARESREGIARYIEKSMSAEMDQHLGYSKHNPARKNSGNSQNGKSKKTIFGES